jgi:branched-chain amino acid transport system substrate-binding protein
LRDALKGLKNVIVSHGVANMSPQGHLGFDQRARMMVKVENGDWKLIP